MSLFEQASRLKLRFDTPKGELSAEDLWGLPLRPTVNKPLCLDGIARALYAKVKQEGEIVSFVSAIPAKKNLDQLRFEIVKYIIDVLLAEERAEKDQAARKMELQKLLEIRAGKEDESLKNLTLDQLNERIAALKV